MKKEVEYVVRLGLMDRYRSRHIRQRGQIVRFIVQYETRIGKNWLPVVRYDTAHGMAQQRSFDSPRASCKNAALYKRL